MSDAPAMAEPTAVKLSMTGRTIARRMEESWRAPVFHLTAELDADVLERARAGLDGVTLNDVLVQRSAQALLANPAVNAHYDPEGLRVLRFAEAHVGIAVATERGLLVPVLRDVQALSLAEIAAGRRALVVLARAGRLSAADMQGGTFTVSNLGMFGIARFDAIVNVPQVAILAVGSARPQLVLEAGVPVERRTIDLTLTCDHRAIDGATGATFLRDLATAS
jgi:pyruvate dehydrogenase E2 component (dihydrolipoamide acetyltransferase)